MNDNLTNPNPTDRKTFTLAVFNALHVMREDLAERRYGQPGYITKALSDMAGFIEHRMAEIRVRRAMLGPLGPKENPEDWDRAAQAIRFFPLWLISEARDMMTNIEFLRAEYDGLTREDAAAVRRELGSIIESSTDA